ncbi:hypothetical protein [Marixanthomonas spongiae]|uniref:Uncharacterized protein n=1 Tax=Marixanthomonas spongiae TaxID=2174845 RepID=A0A2U0HXK9_9FLAO|nr:hypothetical protein [Marixanthomonas spongiae]PVW13577.1 hypothetical protein DDV96_13070 [Marixanthomonas spongiae]
MKPIIIFFLFATGYSSCSQKHEVISEIKLEYTSAMCQGYCDYTFIVNKSLKEVIKTPGKLIQSPELSVKKDTIQLKKNEWQQIRQSFALDSLRALPKINGCPGCNDGAIGSLQIITNKDTLSIKFEGPNPPKTIKSLTEIITKETFNE